MRNVARPAITEEKQHWAMTSIRKRGLNRRWTNILGNTDQTQSHTDTLIITLILEMTSVKTLNYGLENTLTI